MIICWSRNRLMKPTISNLPLYTILSFNSIWRKYYYIIPLFNIILNLTLSSWIYIYVLDCQLWCFIDFNNLRSFFKHPNMGIESLLSFLFVDLKLSVTLLISIIINPIYIAWVITTVPKYYLNWLRPFFRA